MRVLVAEDERINQLYMSHLLTASGHVVDLASDGAQVLSKLKEGSYDLILMDVQMPNVDGVEAARRIRGGDLGADRATVPIVALTAYTSAEDMQRLHAAGIQEIMSKPMAEHELLSLLKRFDSGSGRGSKERDERN